MEIMITISLWTLFVMHLKALNRHYTDNEDGSSDVKQMHERFFTYNNGEMASGNISG